MTIAGIALSARWLGSAPSAGRRMSKSTPASLIPAMTSSAGVGSGMPPGRRASSLRPSDIACMPGVAPSFDSRVPSAPCSGSKSTMAPSPATTAGESMEMPFILRSEFARRDNRSPTIPLLPAMTRTPKGVRTTLCQADDAVPRADLDRGDHAAAEKSASLARTVYLPNPGPPADVARPGCLSCRPRRWIARASRAQLECAVVLFEGCFGIGHMSPRNHTASCQEMHI